MLARMFHGNQRRRGTTALMMESLIPTNQKRENVGSWRILWWVQHFLCCFLVDVHSRHPTLGQIIPIKPPKVGRACVCIWATNRSGLWPWFDFGELSSQFSGLSSVKLEDNFSIWHPIITRATPAPWDSSSSENFHQQQITDRRRRQMWGRSRVGTFTP